MQTRLLAPKAVCHLTSLSRSTLDRLVQAGKFPAPVKITEARLAYNAAAVEAWVDSKIGQGVGHANP